MRTGASDVPSRGLRGQVRLDARLKKTRKTRLRRVFLESEFLEPRTLMATIPAATATGSPVNLTSLSDVTTGGNTNNPMVVINPYNSQQVVAVWGRDLSQVTPVPFTTAVVEGAWSSNGGTSWHTFGLGVDGDASTYPNIVPYTQVTEPSVSFDGQGNFYVLDRQHTGTASGELSLSKFQFTGGGVSQVSVNRVFRWTTGAEQAFDPTLAVDSSLANPPAGVPADPFANNVYVAWASGDIHPANPNVENPFNPNRIMLVVSSDGGQTFSGETIANTGPANGNIGPQDNSHPQLVISRGTGGENPGQVTVAWADFGTNSGPVNLPAVPSDILMSNVVQPGTAIPSIPTSTTTGAIIPPPQSGPDPQGNWAAPAIYNAGPELHGHRGSRVHRSGRCERRYGQRHRCRRS